MKKPIFLDRYADNGEVSHWELINHDTGAVLWSSFPEETIARVQKIEPSLQVEDEAQLNASTLKAQNGMCKDACDSFPECKPCGDMFINKHLSKIKQLQKDYAKVAVSNSELLERAKEDICKEYKVKDWMDFHLKCLADDSLDAETLLAIRFSQLSKEEDAVGLSKWTHLNHWSYCDADGGFWINVITDQVLTDKEITELYNIYKLNK